MKSKYTTILFHMILNLITITSITTNSMQDYYFATANNTCIKILDPTTWKEIEHPNMKHEEGITFITFNPNGKFLASGSYDGIIKIWNTQNWKQIEHSKIALGGEITGLAFSPKGTELASSSSEASMVKIWSTKTYKLKKELPTLEQESIRCLLFSPNSEYLAVAGGDTLEIWDTKTWERKTNIPMDCRIDNIAFSPDSKHIAIGLINKIIIIDTLTWEKINHPAAAMKHAQNTSRILRVLFSPNNEWLASRSNLFSIKIWCPNSMKCKKLIRRCLPKVGPIEFSPDNKFLATAGFDNTIQIVSTKNWEKIEHPEIFHYSCSVFSFAFSPIITDTKIKPIQKKLFERLKNTNPQKTIGAPDIKIITEE